MRTFSRRGSETILLAVVAIISVVPLRYVAESRIWFSAEMGTLAVTLLAASVVEAIAQRTNRLLIAKVLLTTILVTTPTAFAIAARSCGAMIAFEMSVLTTFGAVAVAMAVNARTNRMRSLALIMSGFLLLFSASISDDAYAVALPLLWMLGCVWHLIANRWERLDLAMPESVTRTWSMRPGVMVVALLVLGSGSYAAMGRFQTVNRLSSNVVPTSGGSDWSDPAARGGVGTGDAAIAAKDHAESFGAVDSDIFLESNESTLFDMFNDTIGETKKVKNKWERRQSMGSENLNTPHQRTSSSDQVGGSFSTERSPPKTHRHLEDAKTTSVIQWDGPTGIRLAMQRYDTFDGQSWSQSANLKNDKLLRIEIDGSAWFFDPVVRSTLLHQPEATSVGLLKVIRLASPRIPVPMLTAGIHIQKVDQPDFFGLTEDGSFFMPGREKVPPLTVVHVASVNLMEDEIRDSLALHRPSGNIDKRLEDERLRSYVTQWTAGIDHPHEKLRAIVAHLRTEFQLQREGETTATSLSEFLRSRRGGDHLFATTAALMAKQIGLPSRLVTGFYVRPDAVDIAAGHADVLPRDVHVWAEVQMHDGRWFEIEPTPGYLEPNFRPSWRLFASRLAAAYWPVTACVALALFTLYLSRRIWGDWLLAIIWCPARWLQPRKRIRLAIRIIETRARLAGQYRPVGKSQRAWLEQMAGDDTNIALAARQFSDMADALYFGHGQQMADHSATRLVDLLRVRTIFALTKETTS
jgi:hypothetical protein